MTKRKAEETLAEHPNKRTNMSTTEQQPTPNTAESPPIPATTIDSHQWASIIQYLSPSDLKSLRLAGSKTLLFYNPLFTSHLPLRMDRAVFFGPSKKYGARRIVRWLYNRKRLIVGHDDGAMRCSPNINPLRVESLIKHGFMNSIEQVGMCCTSSYRYTMRALVKLPNLKYLELNDDYPLVGLIEHRGKYYESVVRECGGIIDSLGEADKLEGLGVDFDCVISGSHLKALAGMKKMKRLRLRGFDLSEGIEYLKDLTELEDLHLCHGNSCNAADSDIPSDAFVSLSGLKKLQSIHLENMDCMTYEQMKPICQFTDLQSLTFKHCQEIPGEVLSSIGTMASLKALHFMNCASDEFEPFESEHLVHLQNLKQVKTLSLLFVIIDQFDILDLEGMDALETLNIGIEGSMSKKEFDLLCLRILPVLPSLTKLRIYGADYDCIRELVASIFADQPDYQDTDTLICGKYSIEFRHFEIGSDLVLD